MSTTIIIIIASTLIAIALLTKGLIGKLTSTHPHCQKCKYNLNNLHTQKSNPKTCPECGVNISLKQNTQQGLRQKQKPLIYTALALLIFITTPTIIYSTSQNLTPYKPLWWLNADLNSNDKTTSDTAFQELITRIQAKKIAPTDAMHYFTTLNKSATIDEKHTQLFFVAADSNRYTPSQIQSHLIPLILKRQKNKSKTWHPFLGDAFMQFHASNLTTQKQYFQFIQNAINDTIVNRKTLNINAEKFPVKTKDNLSRANHTKRKYQNSTKFFTPKNKFIPPIWIRSSIQSWSINQQKSTRKSGMTSISQFPQNGNGSSSTNLNLKRNFKKSPLKLGINKTQFTIKYSSHVKYNYNGNNKKPFHIFTKIHHNTIDIKPANVPIITLLPPNTKQDNQFLQSLTIQPLKHQTDNSGDSQISIRISYPTIPANISFQTYIKDKQGNLQKFTTIAAPATPATNGSHTHGSGNFTLKLKPNQSVDVIFTPDIQPALNTVDDITQIYNKSLIFKNVKIIDHKSPVFKLRNIKYTYTPQIYNPKNLKQSGNPPQAGKNLPSNKHNIQTNDNLKHYQYTNLRFHSATLTNSNNISYNKSGATIIPPNSIITPNTLTLNLQYHNLPVDTDYDIYIKPKNKKPYKAEHLTTKKTPTYSSGNIHKTIENKTLKPGDTIDIILISTTPKNKTTNTIPSNTWHQNLIIKNITLTAKRNKNPIPHFPRPYNKQIPTTTNTPQTNP